MFGFLGSSTDKLADQDVSPLSELAVQVYNAVSSGIKLSIISVPESFTLVRLDSLSITTFPFRNHPMVGLGSPDAWQGNIATVLIGSV
jgi:hypothetical protein